MPLQSRSIGNITHYIIIIIKSNYHRLSRLYCTQELYRCTDSVSVSRVEVCGGGGQFAGLGALGALRHLRGPQALSMVAAPDQ